MELVRIPKASENIGEATIGKWLKREGEYVKEGEPLVELLTDKADFVLESPSDGTLRRIVVPEKSSVPVGFVIALVGKPEESLPDIEEENQRLLRKVQLELKVESRRSVVRAGRRVPATPAARRLAKEHSISLQQVASSLGKDGVITEDDVRSYLDGK